MCTKDELRLRLKGIRAAVTDRADKERRILERLTDLTAGFGTVFVYVSMNGEADTHAYIRSCGKTVLVPVTCGGTMRAALYTGGSLDTDRLGNIEGTSPYSAVPDCAVVPMLGFNDALYRIGYGGGYYDRYLKNGVFSIGLSFEECRCAFSPDPYDVPLDVIVTPDAVYRRDTED